MSGAWKETVCFEITGNSPERFLNIANRRGLSVFNVKKENDRVLAFCAASEFNMLSQVAAKCGTNLEVITRYGLSYRLRNYRRRIGFAAGFAVFCFMLWFLSLFVWSVEIVNLPEQYAVSVSDVLYETGIRTGVLVSSIDGKLLEYELENRLPQFDIIAVSCMGCNARVQFSATKPVRKQVEKNDPCDLVASEKGQIVSVTASQGIPFAAEGDIVIPGDVLVSGVFTAQGENVTMVHSCGKVTALVDGTFSESVNYSQIVTEPTGRIINISRIMAFGIEIPLFGSLPEGNYSRSYEEYPLNLYGFAFPIVLRREQWHELCYTEKELSSEECVAQAEEKIDKRIKNTGFLEIASSERTVNETNTGVRVTRYVTFLKEISEERPIEINRSDHTENTESSIN